MRHPREFDWLDWLTIVIFVIALVIGWMDFRSRTLQ
jgi:hypothetical protein